MILISCEEDLVIRNTSFKPSIVVNSIFTVGKPWKVDLTYSKNRLDNQSIIKPILDAEVIVTEKQNNRQIILTHEGNGVYTANTYKPLSDKNYELIVRVKGYEDVVARSKAPKKAQVEILSDVIEKLQFEIKDANSNYYIWDLVFTNTQTPLDTNKTASPTNLVKGINSYNNISSYLQNISTPKTSDADIQGVKTTKYYFSQDEFESTQGGNPDPIKNKYLRLLTTSKELYDYYKSIESYNSSDNHNCSFCQTPEIKSNITNGLGIFAGFTEDFKEIK